MVAPRRIRPRSRAWRHLSASATLRVMKYGYGSLGSVGVISFTDYLQFHQACMWLDRRRVPF
jgi:hypothetical protein